MYLAPTDDQEQLATAVADTLRSESSFERWFQADVDMRAEESRLLKLGAELGWIGFSCPESVGGSEASFPDQILVFRELGARLAPVGITASAIAARLAAEAGDERLARDIISGACKVAIVNETKINRVLGAGDADYALLISAEKLSLSRIDKSHGDLSIDGFTTVSEIDEDLPKSDALTGGVSLHRQLKLLIAAQLQGLARTAVEESNAYAKEREQFGRPIGSFQAVRHRIANMLMDAARAEAQLYFAAASMAEERSDTKFQLNAALLLSQRAALENARINIDNHGAIGVTMENVGHMLLKRALIWRAILGGEEKLIEEIAVSGRPLL